jgi:catechol 2,3-dioxygenase-like lactoylglutathione lyase family enzyme
MLHHISIGVSDILASGEFYDGILMPLGYIRAFEDLRPGEKHQAIGYGFKIDEDKFTIKERFSTELAPGPGFHLAFTAPSRAAVDEWHKRGLELGGKSMGAPKVWAEFGPKYYAAYLTDPDGWQIEVVCKTD